MATAVTVTTYYRDEDYFNSKNSPTYVYGGSSGGGTSINPGNYYTKTELLTDGVLDALYYTESELDGGVLDARYYTETESDARYVLVAGDVYEGVLSFLDSAGSIFFGDATKGLKIQSDGTYLAITKGTATSGLNLSIQSTIPTVYMDSANIYLGAASGTTIRYRGNTLTADTWGISSGGKLSIEQMDSKDVTYASGFSGAGWSIYDQGSNNYLAEFDDLIVRGSMSVYELIVNKIRATGGTLWVTDFVEALSDLTYYSAGVYYFTVDGDNNTLEVDDKIKGQTFTGNNVRSYEYTVSSISTDRTQVRVTGASASDETKNMIFVRVGNATDTSRRGSLFMTASLPNSPYLEVLDGMTTHTIGASNIKARLGNLNGITFSGESLGGYGLYSEHAYLSGKMIATQGSIGDWNILGGNLYSDTGTGDITLDADEASMIIKDSSGIIKVLISKNSIPSWASSFSSSSVDFIGTYAQFYTDVSQILTTGNSDDDTWYCQLVATASSYIDNYTSDQGATKHIVIESDNPHAVVLKWDTALSYSIPSDDTDETDGETHTYTLGGSYDQTITVKAYTSAGTLLATQVNNFTDRTGDLSGEIVFNKVIITDDGKVYFTIQVETENNLRTDDFAQYWEYIGGSWVVVYQVTNYQSLSTTFNMQVNELTLEGGVNHVAIGDNGFMHWGDSDNHFHINEDEGTYYIHSNGPWRHYYGMDIGPTSTSDPMAPVSIYYPITDDIGTPLTTFALNVNTNYAYGHAIGAYNDGNSENRHGILIRCGADTPTTTDNYAIDIQDGNAGTVGSIIFDNTHIAFYYVSDKSMKGEIQEEDLDALEILSQIKYKSWRWKKRVDDKPTDELIGDRVYGYIADDLETLVPSAVKTDPSSGLKLISHESLIPVLQVAINQQQEQIETLQKEIEKLKK